MSEPAGRKTYRIDKNLSSSEIAVMLDLDLENGCFFEKNVSKGLRSEDKHLITIWGEGIQVKMETFMRDGVIKAEIVNDEEFPKKKLGSEGEL